MTYNRIVVVGYLGEDAKVKNIQDSDSSLVIWSIATHEKRKGEKVTTWHRAVIFDAPDPVRLAKKGALVLMEGTLSIRSYTDGDARKIAVEILGNRAMVLDDRQDLKGGESGS